MASQGCTLWGAEPRAASALCPPAPRPFSPNPQHAGTVQWTTLGSAPTLRAPGNKGGNGVSPLQPGPWLLLRCPTSRSGPCRRQPPNRATTLSPSGPSSHLINTALCSIVRASLPLGEVFWPLCYVKRRAFVKTLSTSPATGSTPAPSLVLSSEVPASIFQPRKLRLKEFGPAFTAGPDSGLSPRARPADNLGPQCYPRTHRRARSSCLHQQGHRRPEAPARPSSHSPGTPRKDPPEQRVRGVPPTPCPGPPGHRLQSTAPPAPSLGVCNPRLHH